jgi:hypothetical protein
MSTETTQPPIDVQRMLDEIFDLIRLFPELLIVMPYTMSLVQAEKQRRDEDAAIVRSLAAVEGAYVG